MSARDTRVWPVVIPVCYALASTLYLGLRYGYRWGEQDTGQFMDSIRTIIAAGSINPASGAYPHGYGYQTIAASVTLVTGLSLVHVQLIVLPFLSIAVALAAFAAFRALIGNAVLGGFAALLLLLQPELLFVLQRGNHEKVTYTLILLLVFLLSSSIARRRTVGTIVPYICAFYLLVWTLITTNSFFASSFITGLVLSLVLGLVVLRLANSSHLEQTVVRRLTYTAIAGFALTFIFIGFLYPHARHNFALLESLFDQLVVLVLPVDQTTVDTTTSTSAGMAATPLAISWAAPWIFPMLSAFNIVILAGSAIAWLWLALAFRRGGLPGTYQFLPVWLLAAAFAFQIAVSSALDLTGFLGGNVKIRLFPIFMLFAIPLVVVAASSLAKRIRSSSLRWGATVVAVVMLSVFAALGTLKATNDPLVSNKWLFFTASEQHAMAWIQSQVRGQPIWIGFDERLREMQRTHHLFDPDRDIYIFGGSPKGTRHTLVSDVIAQRSQRLNYPMPIVQYDDRLYDNGKAQLYREVPVTPYQR